MSFLFMPVERKSSDLINIRHALHSEIVQISNRDSVVLSKYIHTTYIYYEQSLRGL